MRQLGIPGRADVPSAFGAPAGAPELTSRPRSQEWLPSTFGPGAVKKWAGERPREPIARKTPPRSGSRGPFAFPHQTALATFSQLPVASGECLTPGRFLCAANLAAGIIGLYGRQFRDACPAEVAVDSSRWASLQAPQTFSLLAATLGAEWC